LLSHHLPPLKHGIQYLKPHFSLSLHNTPYFPLQKTQSFIHKLNPLPKSSKLCKSFTCSFSFSCIHSSKRYVFQLFLTMRS
jgi:hypothetical protein